MEDIPSVSSNPAVLQKSGGAFDRFTPTSAGIGVQAQKISKYIAHWSTVTLFTLLPFFFVPVDWTSIVQAKTLFITITAVVATLAWVATALSEGSVRIPRSLLLVAGSLLPVVYLISAFATGATWTSFVGSVQQDTVASVLIWYALFVACVYVFTSVSDSITSAVRGLLLGGGIVLTIQIIHLIVPSFTFGGALVGQPASVIGSWHDLGIFLGLLFFLSMALLPTPLSQGGVWKILFRAVPLLSFLLLVLINFSDVWIALFALAIGHVLYLWYASRSLEEGARRAAEKRIFWWGAIGIVMLGLYFGGSIIHGLLPSSLQVTQLEVRPSWQGTYTIGSGALSQPSSIFFGSGPNTFPREWAMHKPLSVNTTQFWNIDFYAGVGFIPTSLVTVGLLGAIGWGAVCIAVFLSLWFALRARRIGNGPTIQVVFAATAAYLAAFHLLYVPGPAISAFLFMVFGLVVAAELLSGSVREWRLGLSLDTWKDRASVGLLAVFGIVVLFSGVQSVRALTSDLFVNRSVAIFNETEDFARASRQTEIALTILPHNDRAHRAAVELGLLQFTQLAAQGAETEEARTNLQNTLTATIQHGLQAVALESSNYQNWLSLAKLYGDLAGAGIEGAEEQARAAYTEAQKNNPTNPLPSLGLAQLDLIGANDAGARVHLEKALEIKPDLAAALFLLSQVDARAGDLPKALERAAAVVQIAPNDALGWYNAGTILYAQKDYANAVIALERAVGIQNDYANALFLLSASYAAVDRLPDALTALRAVDALTPGQESVQGMLKKLEAGENPFSGT